MTAITFDSALRAATSLTKSAHDGGSAPDSLWSWVVDLFTTFFEWAGKWITTGMTRFSLWIENPGVWTLVLLWFVIFWAVLLVLFALGFGPAGIIAGSLAAGFQSWMYGAITPAGGVFAVLTSIGMMGIFATPHVIGALVVASLVTGIVALLRGATA